MTDRCNHQWTHQPEAIESERFACAECSITSPACVVTRTGDDGSEALHATGTALLLCERCHRAERGVLADVVDALGHYQRPTPPAVKAARYDRDVLRSSASDGRSTAEQLRDLAEVVESWSEMWAEANGEQPPKWPLDWLAGRILWGAHNPNASAWEDYRREIRQLRHTARRLAGLLPQRQAGPCVRCGGDVVRDWADEHWRPRHDGLSDHLRCTGCGTTWGDRGHWDFVNGYTIALLPRSHPDAQVTLEQARKIYPEVPAATWRSWLLRDRERTEAGEPRLMPEQGWDVRGQGLYLLADLTALVERRSSDTRRGQKVS